MAHLIDWGPGKLVLVLVLLSALGGGCDRGEETEPTPTTTTHGTGQVTQVASTSVATAAAPAVAEGVKLYLGAETLSNEPSGGSTNFECYGQCSYTWPFTLNVALKAQSYGYRLHVSRRFHLKLTLVHQGSETTLVDALRLSAGSPAQGTLGGQPLTGVPGDVLTLELTLPDGGTIMASEAGDPLFGGGGNSSFIILSPAEAPPSPTATPVVGGRLPSTRETTAGPAISVGPDGILHLAWADQTEGSPAIFYARSVDGGGSFSSPVVVADGGDAEARGAPAVAGGPAGAVALAWEEKKDGIWRIGFSRSTDGTEFTAPVSVGASARSGDRAQPALASGADGTLYLAWRDLSVGDTGGIFFARAASSASFGDGMEVSSYPEIQQDPVVAVDNQNRVHLAWSDRRDGPFAVYYARADDGDNFGVVKRVSEAEGDHIPSLAVDKDGGVHVAWASSLLYVYHTYYAFSADGGNTFSLGTMVNDPGPSVSLSPPLTAVAVTSDGMAYVAFLTDSIRDGRVIHYDRRSGGAFGEDITVAGGPDANTLSGPAIATDSQGRVFLAWGDSEQGPFRVHIAQARGGGAFDLEGAARVQG